MAKREPKSLFRRLSALFRSGPVVKRKIRGLDTSLAVADKTKSSGTLLFQKSLSPTYATITSNAYNLSERMMRYQDFQEMEYTPELAAALDIYADETCLSKDSIIPLLDGSRPTILQLYEQNCEDFWLYSFDTTSKKIVPGQATRVIKTGTKQIFRINLDDGTSLRLTGNHRVLLSDGTYVRVDQLPIGASLRSLYTKLSDSSAGDRIHGYEQGVVSIVSEQEEEVFDLEVKNWHNFATTATVDSSSFVFVHNCAQDEKGRILHVYSENEKIKENLEDLFYNVLNVEFNLRSWTRNLCKYGDFFLYNDVSPTYGVVNAFPIPVNEIEREENYDRDDPFAVRYRWVTLGNRTLENWEVTHFRLLGNDMFLPYGSSIIEPARRIWRQLILIEDAMLVYRVVRAPERRVFYVDVANVPPENVSSYIEEQRKNLRTNQVVDRETGRVDLRYNPLPIHKDTPVPLLDGSTLTIENLSKKMNEEPGWIPWVYSVQDGTQKIVPGKVVWCGKNYTANSLTKVWLDDGSYVLTAPEHPYVMRDGSSKRADQISPGDSLMSAYRDLNNRGYERIVEPNGIRNSTHVIVARDAHQSKWNSTEGRVVHYKHPENGASNKRDNRPENLEVMNFCEHRKMHAEHCELTLNRPEQLEERRIKRIAFNKSPEKRKRTSALNKVLGKAKKMGDAYNGSVLHASHNDIRREAQKKSWSLDKDSRSEKMQWIIPNSVVTFVFNEIKSNRSIGREELTSAIRNNSSIMESLRNVNDSNDRNVDKFHVSAVVSKIHRMGCIDKTQYGDFKKFASTHEAPINHQVIKVESITANDDVYCMTVMGTRGEDDRHNFAVNGLGQTTDVNLLKSLIFVRNSVDEDYFIPVRGNDSGTRIETLAGGNNTTAVEDVAYIQKKLFAALKIPRAYLGYDEMLSSKATLAQEDIRFSRTIAVIQKTIIAELNKLAIVHLYAHGFDNEDLQNFTLRLSNPSTVAQQQKLELWRAKFEIGGSLPENMGSAEFVQREVWGLSQEEIEKINAQRMSEKIINAKIEAAGTGGEEGGETDGVGEDLFGGGGGGEEAAGEELAGGAEGETPPEENAGEEPEEEEKPNKELLTSIDDNDEEEEFSLKLSMNDSEKPVRVQPQLKRALYNNSRHITHGASKTHTPDFVKMTGTDSRSMQDPTDSDFMKSIVSNPLGESVTHVKSPFFGLSPDVWSSLKHMDAKFKKDGQSSMASNKDLSGLLSESDDSIEFNDNNEDLPSANEVLIIEGTEDDTEQDDTE